MKLTSAVLRKMVKEETTKQFGKPEDTDKRAHDTKVTDADEYADTLEKKVDYMKALKIEQRRLVKRLKTIKERLQHVTKSLVESA
jgi:hypothetical protein